MLPFRAFSFGRPRSPLVCRLVVPPVTFLIPTLATNLRSAKEISVLKPLSPFPKPFFSLPSTPLLAPPCVVTDPADFALPRAGFLAVYSPLTRKPGLSSPSFERSLLSPRARGGSQTRACSPRPRFPQPRTYAPWAATSCSARLTLPFRPAPLNPRFFPPRNPPPFLHSGDAEERPCRTIEIFFSSLDDSPIFPRQSIL